MSAPLSIETLVGLLPLYDGPKPLQPTDSEAKTVLQSAIYYAKRAAILEDQLTKSRAAIREIRMDATTIRVQAALPQDEDPYPQDPNEA